MLTLNIAEPSTVAEACTLLAETEDAKAIAGGTALTLMMQHGLLEPELLVSLGRIDALRGIDVADETVRIGACTTLDEVARSPQIRQLYPNLAYACSRVANPRIRHVATLGGNMAEADYASDPPSALVSLGASCVVEGPGGERTIPASDFIVSYYTNALDEDELVTAIELPAPAGDQRGVYLKYISRSSEDRPCVGVACSARFDDGAVASIEIVVGAVAGTPQRLPEVASLAIGTSLDEQTVTQIASGYAESIDPIDDGRGSSWYRQRMIEVFVRRALVDVARG